MESNFELKPCPFCGYQPKIRKTMRFATYRRGMFEAYEAVCVNYKCLIFNAKEQYFMNENSAAKAWNTRFEEKKGDSDYYDN